MCIIILSHAILIVTAINCFMAVKGRTLQESWNLSSETRDVTSP